MTGMVHKIGPLPPAEIKRREEFAAKEAAWARVKDESEMFARAKVPARYATADLEHLVSGLPRAYTDICMTLRSLVDEPALMALVGRHGTGKTWMACGLARVFCRNLKSALYCRAIDFFVDLKSTFGGAAKKSLGDVEAIYRRPHLLIIDEMDVRSDTAWEDMVLTSVIDARYAAMKSTLLISNKSREELTDRLGPRLADRFRDNDGCCITCDWPTLRGRKDFEQP